MNRRSAGGRRTGRQEIGGVSAISTGPDLFGGLAGHAEAVEAGPILSLHGVVFDILILALLRLAFRSAGGGLGPDTHPPVVDSLDVEGAGLPDQIDEFAVTVGALVKIGIEI